ncbi:MAG: sel1 repeat family protein, partial [Anaeroplasmataceae bacterium]|nr:sel1 repeat family protein [Anaeroplasmataceae bacterium]
MSNCYYKPCEELNRCLELDNKYWEKDMQKWFEGYLVIAKETSYALAECQVGFAYLEGIGTQKDLEEALYWTTRSAEHGDRDGECNLAWIYEEGLCGEKDLEKAKYWYKKAALQDHDLAIEKCKEYN